MRLTPPLREDYKGVVDIMRTLNLLVVSVGLIVPTVAIAQQQPRTVLMDGSFLLRERSQHDVTVLNAVRAEADRAMKEPPSSVMDKQTTPQSGDKHDYMSLAPYWWPNPATPNHLPYIRRDGQHNPEASAVEDHDNMARMQGNVHALA